MKALILLTLILTQEIALSRTCLDDHDCDVNQVCGKNEDEDVRGYCVQERRQQRNVRDENEQEPKKNMFGQPDRYGKKYLKFLE